MRRWLACAGAMFFAMSSMALAKDSSTKAIYCTQGANGEWSLNKFKPLIKVNGGTVFTEMTFDGRMLEEVRLRRFYKDWELAFDYTFNSSGQLQTLRGSVQVKSVAPPGADPAFVAEFADWLAEAELTPGRDGKIPPHHILYTREKDKIEKPEGADTYVERFNDAPVYRTIQAVPCAAMLKEAEKMNATQE